MKRLIGFVLWPLYVAIEAIGSAIDDACEFFDVDGGD